MKKHKVISSYKHLLDDELAVLAGKIVGAITSNENFPDPVPSVADLKTAVDSYREFHEISVRGGSILERRIKGEKRDELLQVLSQLSFYVNTVADGNLPILTSSALILAKQPEGLVHPHTVEQVVLKDGNLSGQLGVDFKSQKNIWYYEIRVGEWKEDQSTIVWDIVESTTKSRGTIIAPLVPGVRYAVQVRARNSKGYSDWTELVSMIVR